MSAHRDDDVFVDAEEEITPRRSSRKRRSTAGGSITSNKKLKPGRGMPVERSPGKKPADPAKGPPVEITGGQEDFWAKMGGMLGDLESRLSKESEEVKRTFGQAIGELGRRVDRTEKRLDGLAEEVHSIVDTRLAEAMGQIHATKESCGDALRDPDQGPSTSYAAVAATTQPSTRKTMTANREENRYWECRKSLRLRPISTGDDKESVKTFMTEHLRIDSATMSDIGDFRVRRVPAGPGSKIQREAIVTFETIDARDVVKASARNLAGKGADYGVRLEIPNKLKTAMKDLQAASYQIKQRHPDARRNVLLDDDNMDLVLDFSLKEGGPWRRMTSKQARTRRTKSKPGGGHRLDVGDDELDEILDSSFEKAGQPSP